MVRGPAAAIVISFRSCVSLKSEKRVNSRQLFFLLYLVDVGNTSRNRSCVRQVKSTQTGRQAGGREEDRPGAVVVGIKSGGGHPDMCSHSTCVCETSINNIVWERYASQCVTTLRRQYGTAKVLRFLQYALLNSNPILVHLHNTSDSSRPVVDPPRWILMHALICRCKMSHGRTCILQISHADKHVAHAPCSVQIPPDEK